MGFVFNGVHSNTLNIKVKTYQKPILPPVSVYSYDVPGKPGGYITNKKLSPRDIIVSIYFVGIGDSDYESKARSIAPWLHTISPSLLILDEEPDRYYSVVVNGNTDLEQVLYYGRGDITFTCYDPFAYSNSIDTYTWDTGSPTSIMKNNGSFEVFPSFNFTAWATTITITNITTGKKLELSGLTVGDVLAIDNSAGSVMRDGNPANNFLSLDSEFFPLQVGDNNISCGASTHNTITTTWRKRYL